MKNFINKNLIDIDNLLDKSLDAIGQQHLKENCMNYYQHCTFSLSLSYYFLKGLYGSVVHAFIPSYMKTSSTDNIKIIKEKLDISMCDKSETEKDNLIFSKE